MRSESVLSEQSATRLAQWLRGQQVLSEPQWHPPDIRTLVHYRAGALDVENMESVERALVADEYCRNLWLEVNDILDVLTSLPLAQVEKEAAGTGLSAQVAQEWLKLLSERSQRLSRFTGWWNHLLQAAEATIEQTALYAAWLRQRWLAATQVPAFATVRSGARAQVLMNNQSASDIQVQVCHFALEAQSILHVHIEAREANGEISNRLDGTPVLVALNIGDEAVPLAQGTFTDGAFQTHVPLEGTGTLPQGTLPEHLLLIAVGSPSQVHTRQWGRIPIEVQGKYPFWMEVQDTPQCRSGIFSAKVRLPEAVFHQYAHHQLALEIMVVPQQWQTLGVWHVDKLAQAGTELSCSCPNFADIAFPTTMLLRARLTPVWKEGERHV